MHTFQKEFCIIQISKYVNRNHPLNFLIEKIIQPLINAKIYHSFYLNIRIYLTNDAKLYLVCAVTMKYFHNVASHNDQYSSGSQIYLFHENRKIFKTLREQLSG